MRVVFCSIVVSSTLLGLPTSAYSSNKDYKTGLTQIRYANAYCESGGNPYNRRNSKYRGKWQFDQTTWNSFAPAAWRGRDPAGVPEAVQDLVALRVTYDAWPNC